MNAPPASDDRGVATGRGARVDPIDRQVRDDGGGDIRLRRLLPSSGWSLAGTTVTSIYSFLLVSYLLRTLGPEAFAPWAAAVALLGYLSLLDAGLSATTTRDAAHVAAGDTGAVERIRAANSMFAGLAVVASALGLIAALAIPSFLGLDGRAGVDAASVALILTLDFAIVLGTAGWVGILRGHQRYDLIFACNLTHALVGGVVVVASIDSLGMVGAALGQVVGRSASRVLLAILLRQRFPWFHVVPGLTSRGRIRALWAFSLPVFALQLATQIGIGTDVIIVGVVSGAASVGLYAAGGQLVRNVAYLILPLLSVLLPALSRATFENALSTARQVPTLLMIAAILGSATFVGLASEAAPVMQLWSGSQPPLSIGVLIVYSIAFAVITPVQVLVLGLIATGRHSLIGTVVLLDSLVNVALSVVLAIAIGPIGVAVSTLIVVAIDDGVLIPILASRRLGFRPRTVFLALYGGLAIGVAIVGFGQLLPVDGVAGLVIRLVACGLAAVAAMAAVWRIAPFAGRDRAEVAIPG